MKGEPIHSNALDGENCWQCGYKYVTATNLTGTEPMMAGDVVVCPLCGAVSVVDEKDGVLFTRPPDVTGPDAALGENQELIDLLIMRTMYSSGLLRRHCPKCNALVRQPDGERIPGSGDAVPLPEGQRVLRSGDTIGCECGALLQIQGDLSVALKEE